MVVKNRRLVKPEDLNPRGTLFGGRLLEWIDEEAAIFTICQLGTENIVTKLMSEINFVSPAKSGDVVEIGMEVVKIGRTSITLKCQVLNKNTKNEIITIDKMVFVSVDENGKSTPHFAIRKKEKAELIETLRKGFEDKFKINVGEDSEIYITDGEKTFAMWFDDDFNEKTLITNSKRTIDMLLHAEGVYPLKQVELSRLILKTLNNE